ncbi:MAG: hypothetical protein WCF18_08605 [Chthoniobacteraceae bacterium]
MPFLDDFEDRFFPMPRGSRCEQIPNGDDCVTVLADHFPHIALPQAKQKQSLLRCVDFGQNHLIGVIDEIPDDEIEKFLHGAGP